MKITRIASLDIWIMSKGNRVLYRGKESPWHSPKVLRTALRRDGIRLVG